MKFKDVVTSEASTEAKVAALALLLDKELIKLADTVLNVKKLEGPKGEQGIQGPKGEQGDRGFDGANGKDGADGKDGKDGEDGKQGVGVADAKIDFDGSLVITLTDGTEINAGDVVPLETAEKIKVIGNGGGTSQSVLDAIDAINAIIATYGTMATQNANAVAITGGSINGTSIGSTTPAAGTFTTLTATGQTSLGGAAGSESVIVPTSLSSGGTILYAHGGTASGTTGGRVYAGGSATDVPLLLASKGSGGSIKFFTNESNYSSTWSNRQLQVSHTVSAVNYVQVTGAATGGNPTISAQGSDANVSLTFLSKASSGIYFQTRGGGTARNALVIGDNGAASVNYLTISSNVASSAPSISATGSDTNISQVFQSKGTGAIDLAAGSRGVNISNGGTVTAITRTNGGTVAYTSAPSVVISAPTTAGGVQATAVARMQVASDPTIASGGTGYAVNDVITVVGGTYATIATFTVTAVSGGVITTAVRNSFGDYTVTPTNPISVTGGTGSGATFNLGWNVNPTGFNITNAGSGYVEQPTVTFSGGGGSGAAAYATVGSGTVVKSIGSTMSFSTPGGEAFRVIDGGTAAVNYVGVRGSNGALAGIEVGGSATNSAMWVTSKGTENLRFFTNLYAQEQFRVAHTASAVNYVQVTGAATGGDVAISAQGSDANIALQLNSKGNQWIKFNTNSALGFAVAPLASAVNYIRAQGATVGNAPSFAALGNDTNIDLALTPKGTGNVRFGTLTASADAPITGYITIKDSGGTVRKLAVVA